MELGKGLEERSQRTKGKAIYIKAHLQLPEDKGLQLLIWFGVFLQREDHRVNQPKAI